MKRLPIITFSLFFIAACVSNQIKTTETQWFEGELKAAKTPVIITIKGLKPNTPYNIQVYDRYHQSEKKETASTKTTLMRPDRSVPKSYKGTHILDTKERANAPYAVERAELASAFLFDGGDQSIYYRAWIDSGFANSVNKALSRKQASIGGNSAGLAILGDIVYAALHDESFTADEALQNPYTPLMTLRKGLFRIPELKGAITETHFSERNRQGRLIAFLARILADNMLSLADAYGIAVDENTCLVIDNTGKTKVYGPGSAWIYVPQSMPDICKEGFPLTWKGNAIKVIQLTPQSQAYTWATIKQAPANFYYEVIEGKLHKR